MKRLLLTMGLLWLVSTPPVYALTDTITCVYPKAESIIEYEYFQDGQGSAYTNIFLVVKTENDFGKPIRMYSYNLDRVPRIINFVRGNVKGLVIQNVYNK